MSSRHLNYTIGEGEDKTDLRLRKWSVTKLRSLLRDIGELAKKIGEEIDLKQENLQVGQIAPVLMELGDDAIQRITRILVESIERPQLKENEILEWDMETFVEVLTKVIEQNFTDKLLKNFSSLKASVVSRMPSGLFARSQTNTSVSPKSPKQ